MCFEIDNSAPKPTQKIVYKVLAVFGANLVSPYKRGVSWRLRRKTDIRTESDPSPLVSIRVEAFKGLYVFLTKKGAEKFMHERFYNSGTPHVIVECRVNSDDYIHSSLPRYGGYPGREATYYALTPWRIVAARFAKGDDSAIAASIKRRIAAAKKVKK